MAGPNKELSLKITAKGGDTAAVEIAKAAEALERFEESAKTLGDKKDLAGALDGLVKGMESLGADAAPAAEALGEALAEVNGEIAKMESVEAAAATATAEAGRIGSLVSQGEALNELKPALEGATDATKKATEATGEMFPTFEKAGDRVQDLGDTLSKQGGKLNAFARLLSGAGGGVQRFGGSLLSLAGGPIGIAIGGLALITKGISFLQDRLEKAREAASRAFPDLVSGSGDASIAAEALAISQDKVSTSMANTDKAVDGYITRLEKAVGLEKQLVDATLEEDLAGIDLDQATGAIDEGQAADAAFEARKKASEDKRRMDRKILELEKLEREAAADAARQDYLATLSPAQDAQANLDALQSQGPSGAPSLRELREARNKASSKFAQVPRDDPEKIEALEEAFKDAQSALIEGFDDLVTQRLDERSGLIDRVKAAGDRSAAANNAVTESERGLADFGGKGEEIFRRQQEASARRHDAERARRKRSERGDGTDQVDQEALNLARALESNLNNPGARDALGVELVATLKSFAAKLSDGTNSEELVGLLQDLTTAQTTTTVNLSAVEKQVQNLRGQLKNNR